MNARCLLFTLFVLIIVGLSIRSRSTLTPERGVDHVFYGSYNNFMAQEVTSGNFNGDQYEDVVASLKWDSPGGCDAVPQRISPETACPNGIGRWLAEKGVEDTLICAFSDPDLAEAQRAYWEDECGWTVVDTLSCGECWQALWFVEDQGAVHVEMGGDWSGKGHDIDLPTAGSDHMVVGMKQGDGIYNGLAAGNVDGDPSNYDELILGADQRRNGGPGEVYVISGGESWPDTIRPPDDDLVMHYFLGRDSLDAFGAGIAAGDLNNDGEADIVVAAPLGNGPSNGRPYSGEVYVFYSVDSLKATVDLSELSDAQLATSPYAQVIWGAAANDSTGVTIVRERHQEDGNNIGDYEPVGLAIGDWDGDGRNDLAIGAGAAGAHTAYQGGDGAVYVIFGGGAANKLRPGHTIDLSGDLGTSDAADVRVVGKDGSALGAGVAFVDADGEGDPGPGEGKDDLVLGAPYAALGGDSVSWDYKGEAYIIWGDTKENLTSNADRHAGDSSDIDVTIIGQDGNDQLGGHISGNRDLDGDGKNDIGIAGQDAAFVFFGQARGDWESEIDLATVLDTDPDTRILALKNVGPEANSTTIRLAHVDDDLSHADLVFGGYDLPGVDGAAVPDQRHAGQMWMMSGSDLWKSGTVSSSQTWSGNVFLQGDILVDDGATLTIAAGTDIWVWPKDPGPNLGVDSLLVEIYVNDGSLVIQGAVADSVRIQAWTMDGADTDSGTEWRGIWIGEDGTASIDHAIIRNAYYAVQSRAGFTLKNSLIEDCEYLGISVGGDSTSIDSVYVENTVLQNFVDDEAVAVNVLGDGAAVRLNNCTINGCETGIAVYTEGKLYTSGTTVKNCSVFGVRANGDSYVSMLNTTVEDVTTSALRVYDGSLVWTGNCTFQTSDIGVEVSPGGGADPHVTLYQGHLLDNNVGLYVSGADDVSLTSGEANGNVDEGVYCLAGADIVVSYSNLEENTLGVRCDNSAPSITNNYIAENSGGIRSENYANPTIEANHVWNNTGGIAFIDDGTANMDPCAGSCPPCSDGNSFKENSGYHFTNFTATTIDAECNYWGQSTPKTSKFYGPVDYTPYLSSDPLPGPSAPLSQPIDRKLPRVYSLTGNAPNPFNPVTMIRYEVPPPGGQVGMRVYNVRGQLVRVLVNEHVVPGFHTVPWNGVDDRGREVASGVYFLQMTAPNFKAARKIVMLK